MKPHRSHTIAAALAALLAPGGAQALILVDSDDAGAAVYADGWGLFDDGSVNPGSLGGWVLGGNASDPGTIDITSSTGLGAGGAIDSAGVAFKVHDTTGGFVDLFRFFDPDGLEAGQTFSMELAVNFRGGFKGMDLRSDAGDATIFNFNIGGDDYTVSSAATGNGSVGADYAPDTVFSLSFTQVDLTGGTWSITRSGGVSDFDSGTYTGRAKSIKLYSGGQGTAGEDAIYYNNFQVTEVPEPSTAALAGVGALMAMSRRRRAVA
ncbi:MAG: PEP-CTERM sorting domain-containing protein [Planctomycetota bacterium]